MRAIIVSLLLTLSLVDIAAAQTPAPANTPNPALPMGNPSWPTRVFQIKYVDIQDLAALLSPFITNGMDWRTDNNLRAISVRGPAPTLSAIEEAIKRFDVPANSVKTVEFTAYILVGSQGNESDSVPATLRQVVDQLRNIMAYKSYSLLETLTGRGVEGKDVNSLGSITWAGHPQENYQFHERTHVSGEGADQTVRFDPINFVLGANPAMQITTSLDIKKGQQIVVGKTTLRDQAIILVMTAKVVD